MFYTAEEAAIVCGFFTVRELRELTRWIGPALMSLCGDATRHSSLALQRKRCSQRTTDGRRMFSAF